MNRFKILPTKLYFILIYGKVLVIILFIQGRVFSQADSNNLTHHFEDILIENIENKVENSDEEADYSEELGELILNGQNKIPLNFLTPEVAVNILKLSEYQYYQLELYIEKYGSLLTINELAAIEGFTMDDVNRLSPYIDMKAAPRKSKSFADFFRHPKNELLLRYGLILEKSAGYDTTNENHYLGAPFRLCFRYKFTAGRNISFGFAGEKDAGEELFSGTQKQGFDHYAFNVSLRNVGIIKYLVVGDYKLNLGQGVVIGSGLMSGKGSGAGGIRKFATGIQPCASMNEGTFFRGIATTLGKSPLNGTIFYSYQFYDGLLTTENEENEAYFEGTLSDDGYHRTTEEISKKNILLSRLYGVDITLRKRIYKIGMRAVRTDFANTITESDELYKKYDFSGKYNYNIGIDYQVLIRKCILFGEAGISKSWGKAFIQGFITEPDPKVKISLLFRYYDKNYSAFNSGAFGENSRNNNEFGLYFASDIITGRNTELQLYSDLYYFPWLRFRTDKPTSGLEMGAGFNIDLTRDCHFYIKYLFKKKETNSGDNQYFNEISTLNKHKLRGCLSYVLYERITLKSEADFVCNSLESSGCPKLGILVFQDVGYSFQKINLDIKLRIALFDTDSYEERIYAYEQDLYQAFNVTGYYFQGWRGYLMLKYRYKFVDIWLRIAQTYYSNKTEIGSGADLIESPHKTELKVQLLFHF
jgi:hypothetical protein